MRELIVSVLCKVFNWIMALFIRPTIKVTHFEIEEADVKKKKISFSALISNNTNKVFSVSQKYLLIYGGNKEITKIDVTRYQLVKKKDGLDELNILSPIDDIITLQPGDTKEIKIYDHNIDAYKVNKVKFSCYTGRKTCTFRIKIPKRNVSVSKNEPEKMSEQDKQLIKTNIKKYLSILNTNIGAVTWIATVAVAIIATCLKFLWYVFQRGILLYWNIDSTAISLMEGTTLYSIFLLFIIGVLVISIMLIPYIIAKSRMKTWKKWTCFIILYLLFYLITVVSSNAYVLFSEQGVIGIVASVIASTVLFIIFFSPSWMFGRIIDQQKKEECGEKNSLKGVVIYIVTLFIIMTLYIGYVGYDSAKRQTNFRVTEDGYAIIYETNDYYYLAEYNPDNKSVNKNHQIVVKKENVEYFYRIYED